ncbi:C1 family peptidase [Mesoaciditoga lauensis]|uniref:C1 family peptidase n=1 Tax=Mesoaciditoga lauensis TaxID=1495039 RepID=UPI001477875A|nr:C1 family peptidase [Mesoaciditoga lauensis]
MKKTTILIVISLVILSAFTFAINFNSNTVYNQQLIDQINAYNASHNLPWKAALNPTFKDKTLAELKVLDGRRTLPNKIEQQIVEFFKSRHLTTTDNAIMAYYTLFDPTVMDDSNLPENYDLRDVNGVTPIKDQGWHGTCWAFSTAETMESAMIKQLGKDYIATHYPFLGATPVLSTQYIAYHNVDINLIYGSGGWEIQDSNSDLYGGNQYFSFYNATRYGLAPASDFPYNAYENTPWISWDPQTPDWKDHLVKPTGALLLLGAPAEKTYFGVTYDQYIDAIKTMIKDYGSVSVAFAVPADFGAYKEGIYVPATPITYVGGHAVQIVGWKSNVATNDTVYPTVWIVRNSWNTTWGDNGYWEQPAVTPEEYASGKVPAWKFASTGWWFYVPIFTKPDSVDWQAADFNNDGVVNMTDYDLLMSALNETNPSSSTIAKYDIGIPKDGRIDGNDVSEFMYLWNKAAAAH